jgi:hypothetical protein
MFRALAYCDGCTETCTPYSVQPARARARAEAAGGDLFRPPTVAEDHVPGMEGFRLSFESRGLWGCCIGLGIMTMIMTIYHQPVVALCQVYTTI